jgi:membrane protease YdiL (CAAX protease family)
MGSVMGMLFPWFSNVNDAAVSSLLRLDYIPMLIGTILLVPIAEEVLYRGVVFGSLYVKNHTLGYVLGTAIFCAVHIIGYIGVYEPLTLALCFIQYIPAGLCLAWAYTESENIFAPILVHMAVNAMGVYALR